MSTKFWVFATVLSLITAHLYFYTDVLRQNDVEKKPAIAKYMSDILYIMTDGVEQLKRQIKWRVEVAQKLAQKARKDIAHSRRSRQAARAKRAFQSA